MKIDRGEYRSIYGDSLTKIYKFSKDNPDLFESDVRLKLLEFWWIHILIQMISQRDT